MPRKLILLIDHEAAVREVLQICLSRLAHWDVLSVASLATGLELLNVKKPDAILLDLPVLDQHASVSIQQLKKCSDQAIPILLITASARWFSPQQLQEMGVRGAIAKPFNPITLPGQISELLQWSSCKDEEASVNLKSG